MQKQGESVKVLIDHNSPTCNSLTNVTARHKTREPGHILRPFTDSCHGSPQVERQSVSFDVTLLHRIYSECDRRIDTLTRRVREGVEVLAAADFVRWLQFSGFIELVEPFACEGLLPIRPVQLRSKCCDLVYECGEYFRTHEHANYLPDPTVPRCELERIAARLLQIEKHLSNLPPVASDTDEVGALSPALRVIPGGTST